MFCEKCGQKLADGARFCESCGEPVAAPPAGAMHTRAPAEQPAPPMSPAAPTPEPASPSTPGGGYARPDAAPDKKKKKGRAKVVVIVLICVLLTAALSVLLVMLLNNMNSQAGQIASAPSLPVQSSDFPTAALTETVTEAPTAAVTEPPTEAPTAPPTEPATVGSQVDSVVDAAYFTGATASSTLPNQAGHNYSAANVLHPDGACWCEGSDGYGEGEWIRLDLPAVQKLSGLTLINGYAGTERQYSYNSKPSSILIEFSDGQSTTAQLKVYPVSQRDTMQTITFSSPVETSYVKITIQSVEKGDCADTCLTYVAPF